MKKVKAKRDYTEIAVARKNIDIILDRHPVRFTLCHIWHTHNVVAALSLGGKKNMKYFVTNDQRKSTAYHEFFKGRWDEKSFWRKESIYLFDDELVSHKGFYHALCQAVPGYDPYEMIEVSRENWKAVRECIPEDDTESIELYEEADAWAKEVFKEFSCFTVLGL